MKRSYTHILITFLLTIATFVPTCAEVLTGPCGSNVTYSLDTESGVLKIEGTGLMKNFTSPKDTPWYPNKDAIKSVEITNGVTNIEQYSFYGCSGLTSITIPSSVTNVGKSAFDGCYSLPVIDNIRYADTYAVTGIYSKETASTVYNIKEGTRFIGDYAFSEGRYATSVTIPNTVIRIGSRAFYCSNLTSITIPSSVVYIAEDAFAECSFLREDFVNNSSCISDSYWGAQIMDKTKEGLIISGTTVVGCDKQVKSISIPDSIKSISDHAFDGCSELTSVSIPNSVTYIGLAAFKDCSSLSSVTIPNSVWNINRSAFQGCTRLTSIIISNTIQSIGSLTFEGCSSLTSVTIPASVTSIGSSAFQGCSALKALIIPNSVTSLGANAFQNCYGIKTLTLPNKLKSVAQYAFDGCSGLTSVVIPASVTSIEDYAFQNCSSLVAVKLPENLTTIKKNAFYGCKKLESMTLPSGITTLGVNFVSNCKELYAPFSKIVNANVSLTGTLHVPYGATQAFRDNGWIATNIVEDIDIPFLIAKGTLGNISWRIENGTLSFSASYANAEMPSYYYYCGRSDSSSKIKTNDQANYEKYPWYAYRNIVNHVIFDKNITAIGWGCLNSMNNLESVVTYTAKVSYGNGSYGECFGEFFGREYNNYSSTYLYFDLAIPNSLTKIVYKGDKFNIQYFSGNIRSYQWSDCWYNEFHPVTPLEIIADNVAQFEYSGKKALRNTKLYLTYTGELTSGIFCDLGDLYSLTLNATGVATEAGAFYTLFGNAYYNMDMMYGGGNYYIPKNLKELHLMEGVTSIPEACFKNVTSLEKVYLPSTLRGVQDNAFLNCDGLTDIYVNAAMPPSAKDNSFDGVNMFLCTLHVPYDSKQYYSIAKGWKDFYTIDNNADVRFTIVKNIENAGQIIGNTSYMNGEFTDITAVPNEGYRFVEWTDDAGNSVSRNSKLIFEADSSCIYHAIFTSVSNSSAVNSAIEGTKITLAWTPVDGVEYYKVQIYTDPEMTTMVKEVVVDANGKVITRGVSDLSVTISELDQNTIHYYRILGYNQDDSLQDEYSGSFVTGETTGVEDIPSSAEDEIIGIYNLRGELIDYMTKGVNIIRTKNGIVRKVFVK